MVHPFTRIVTLAYAVALAAAELDPLSDDFIDLINSMQTSWRAGRNFPKDTPYSYIKSLTGVLEGDSGVQLRNFEHNADSKANLPESFDPREKWPNCPSLSEIKDQGSCGSCWAFAAVEAMTDRYCIHSNGTKQFHFSAEDLLSCCGEECGTCQGGYPNLAWHFWKQNGLVSGGSYGSRQGCRPYSIPGCNHTTAHLLEGLPHCKNIAPTPTCLEQCEDGYDVTYEKDKQYGLEVNTFQGEDNIMAELYKNGPLEVVFKVYQDFGTYTTGVYQHTYGNYTGLHAVKIIGWGVENGIKYWLIANSWNKGWGGLNGFFKFLRGKNHCCIEEGAIGGVPKVVI